jgi:hypothetical protein
VIFFFEITSVTVFMDSSKLSYIPYRIRVRFAPNTQLVYPDIFICLTAGFGQGYSPDTSRYLLDTLHVADPFQCHFSTISIDIESPHTQPHKMLIEDLINHQMPFEKSQNIVAAGGNQSHDLVAPKEIPYHYNSLHLLKYVLSYIYIYILTSSILFAFNFFYYTTFIFQIYFIYKFIIYYY